MLSLIFQLRKVIAMKKYNGKELYKGLLFIKSMMSMNNVNRQKELDQTYVDCQHFFRQIFLGYFSDIVQAFDTLRKNVWRPFQVLCKR